MQVNLTDGMTGATKSTIELKDEIFSLPFNEPLVHQIVVAYLAKGRAGTHEQKTRSEVSGGGKKPWKQKGTGRARAGSIRSPLWRKGGVTFAAKPRDYAQKVNKKMYRGAMRSIWSELLRQGRLHIVDAFTMDVPKTKDLIAKLQTMNLQNNVLISLDKLDDNLILASRNIDNIAVTDITRVDPVSLIKYENVVVTQAAIKCVEELLA